MVFRKDKERFREREFFYYDNVRFGEKEVESVRGFLGRKSCRVMFFRLIGSRGMFLGVFRIRRF